MNKKLFIISFIALSLFLASCSYESKNVSNTSDKMMKDTKEDNGMMENKNDTMMTNDKDTMMDEKKDGMMSDENTGSMMEEKNDNMMNDTKDDMMADEGYFGDYSKDKLSKTKKNVLFFSATWCPACQTANKNFTSEKVPKNLNVLRVDYDNSSDLKTKYGVTMQHTYVLVDENLNMIKKWSGSKTFEDVVSQVN